MIKEVVYNGKTYTAEPTPDEDGPCRGCSFKGMPGSCADAPPCCEDDELDGEVLPHHIIWVEKK